MIALKEKEREALRQALRGNSQDGLALLMGRDTSFVGTTDEMDLDNESKTIDACRSVPTHY